MNSHEVFIHIHQGCFAGTGAIVRLPQCQWSKPDGYGKISQCITTTKHSKAKTVCIFLGIYCTITVSPLWISGKLGWLFPLLLRSLCWSHYHQYAGLSESIEHVKCLWSIICRVWLKQWIKCWLEADRTNSLHKKWLSNSTHTCIAKLYEILSISQLFVIQYTGQRAFSLVISFVEWENVCSSFLHRIIIITLQAWIICIIYSLVMKQ